MDRDKSLQSPYANEADFDTLRSKLLYATTFSKQSPGLDISSGRLREVQLY